MIGTAVLRMKEGLPNASSAGWQPRDHHGAGLGLTQGQRRRPPPMPGMSLTSPPLLGGQSTGKSNATLRVLLVGFIAALAVVAVYAAGFGAEADAGITFVKIATSKRLFQTEAQSADKLRQAHKEHERLDHERLETLSRDKKLRLQAHSKQVSLGNSTPGQELPEGTLASSDTGVSLGLKAEVYSSAAFGLNAPSLADVIFTSTERRWNGWSPDDVSSANDLATRTAIWYRNERDFEDQFPVVETDPNGTYFYRFKGYLIFPGPGQFEFNFTHTGAVMLLIDNQIILDGAASTTGEPVHTYSNISGVSTGPHPIVIAMRTAGPGHVLEAAWRKLEPGRASRFSPMCREDAGEDECQPTGPGFPIIEPEMEPHLAVEEYGPASVTEDESGADQMPMLGMNASDALDTATRDVLEYGHNFTQPPPAADGLDNFNAPQPNDPNPNNVPQVAQGEEPAAEPFVASSPNSFPAAEPEGDTANADDDNDGVPGSMDAFPLDPTRPNSWLPGHNGTTAAPSAEPNSGAAPGGEPANFSTASPFAAEIQPSPNMSAVLPNVSAHQVASDEHRDAARAAAEAHLELKHAANSSEVAHAKHDAAVAAHLLAESDDHLDEADTAAAAASGAPPANHSRESVPPADGSSGSPPPADGSGEAPPTDDSGDSPPADDNAGSPHDNAGSPPPGDGSGGSSSTDDSGDSPPADDSSTGSPPPADDGSGASPPPSPPPPSGSSSGPSSPSDGSSGSSPPSRDGSGSSGSGSPPPPPSSDDSSSGSPHSGGSGSDSSEDHHNTVGSLAAENSHLRGLVRQLQSTLRTKIRECDGTELELATTSLAAVPDSSSNVSMAVLFEDVSAEIDWNGDLQRNASIPATP